MRRRAIPPCLQTDAAAWRWANKNVDMNLDHWDLTMDDVKARARAYATFARRAEHRGTVDVYRMVLVPSVKDVQIDNLGKYWSRYAKSTGTYAAPVKKTHMGGGRYRLGLTPGKDVLIHGLVAAKDVHWEFGFKNFMFFGENQWELALKRNVPVQVVAIGSRRLTPPLDGNSGHARDEWS
jgi:hypothetical protein